VGEAFLGMSGFESIAARLPRRSPAVLARACMALGFAALLAACQATSTEEVLKVEPKLPAPAQETVGTGPTMIAMLLPRNGAEPLAGRARDDFEAAKLAIADLGGGTVRLTAYETGGDPANTRFMAEQAIAAGARLIVGPIDTASLAQVAAIAPKGRPPILALTGSGGRPGGVFAFASDAVDSALEGVRAAVSADQSQVVLLLPQGFPDADRARLAAGVTQLKGKLLGTVAYPLEAAAMPAALKAQQPVFAKATTAVIFGDAAAPAQVARALISGGFGATITTLVGNSSWPRQIYADSVLDGAVVALPDQDSLAQISSRYAAAAGRPLSVEAALAYDAVALGAGLVRARGADAITLQALTSDTGFRGAAGLFRLRKDGSVDRRHTVYRIEGGKLNVLQGQGDGF
jgi:hypothetical protein